MKALESLVERWGIEAEVLERHHDDRGAALLRLHVLQLLEAIRSHEDEQLTLADAARESDLSYDHLRHEVAAGRIPNAGRKGSPRIRRADLPLKRRGATGDAFDPQAEAADVLRLHTEGAA